MSTLDDALTDIGAALARAREAGATVTSSHTGTSTSLSISANITVPATTVTPTPPPADDKPPVTEATPAQVLNIGSGPGQNHFDLQTVGGGAFVQVPLEKLAAGYSNLNFTTASPTRVALRVDIDDPTTPGSSYARTELREVNADGTKAAWDALTGTHELTYRIRVDHLPPNKPEVVVAQLHNGDSDRVAIRTQLISGQSKLLFRINGTSQGYPRLSETYVPGTWIVGKIRLVDGAVEIYHGDLTKPFHVVPAGVLTSTGSPSWYFKTGLYAQTNPTTDPATEYVSGQMEAPSIAHGGAR